MPSHSASAPQPDAAHKPSTVPTVQLKVLHPKLGSVWPLPASMSTLAAGVDLPAAIDAALTLAPQERRLVPCGFAMALPVGYEAQVHPRSGLAYKHGLTCLNSPGTIDADFRGEVQVLLVNLGQEPFVIEPGMRIAQMVVAKVPTVQFVRVDVLGATDRGEAGFGSTGA